MNQIKHIVKNLTSLLLTQAIILIIFAILIIIYPDVLNYLVAGFLILIGLDLIYYAIKINRYYKKVLSFWEKFIPAKK